MGLMYPVENDNKEKYSGIKNLVRHKGFGKNVITSTTCDPIHTFKFFIYPVDDMKL